MEENDTICHFCGKTPFKYVCPRCNVAYCSVECYQSPSHMDCSETFYKENIQEWLSSEGEDSESKKKMVEILKRVQNQEEIMSDDDSDDEMCLSDRLAEIDLEDSDTVWSKLLPEEKREFLELVKSGDVSKLIPEWEPWWESKHVLPKVRFVDEPYEPPYITLCPKIRTVAAFSSITKSTPSPNVYFNLINILSSYAITARYMNGDFQELPAEAASIFVQISKTLHSNEVFTDFETAIESTIQTVIDCVWITLNPDPNRISSLTKDVRSIIEGPNDTDSLYYVKVALSDCIHILETAKNLTKKVSRNGTFSKMFEKRSADNIPSLTRDSLTKHLKKIEYYLSWSDTYLINCKSI